LLDLPGGRHCAVASQLSLHLSKAGSRAMPCPLATAVGRQKVSLWLASSRDGQWHSWRRRCPATLSGRVTVSTLMPCTLYLVSVLMGLVSSNHREERYCRFCSSNLPDWRNTLSAGVTDMQQVPPVMTVLHSGQVYVIPVQPGPHGLEQFQENIRKIFGYDQQVEINLSFGCTVPGSGESLDPAVVGLGTP
jgi:hypothetical protein